MQNTNIVATYDYYTLDRARQTISEENRQKAIRRAERKARKRAETIYYIKQKLSGLTMASIGIITPILLDGDCTFSLFALPVGIWLLFTKEKVMMFWLKRKLNREVLSGWKIKNLSAFIIGKMEVNTWIKQLYR